MAPALPWVVLTASFAVGLAAIMRMAGPAALGDEPGGVIRLPGPMRATVFALFALAALVFLADVVRRGLFRRRPADGELDPVAEPPRIPPWLRAVMQIASLVNLVLLAYLVWRGAIPLHGLLSLVSGVREGAGLELGMEPEGAPPLITWTFGILALAAGLGTFALAVWSALADRVAARGEPEVHDPPHAPLAQAVEEALDDLQAEPDARRAIIRCYASFERAAAAAGLARKTWLTPMEFMREALGRLPVPRAALPALTELFELARFSHHALGRAERERALAALVEIRTAMGAGSGDAGAR